MTKTHGSRMVNGQGYVSIYVGRDHPMAGTAGYCQEHRLVMSATLGRPLLATENVHHRNGQRQDNRPANLELWSRSQPHGQRVRDLLAWARELIEVYGPIEGLLP